MDSSLVSQMSIDQESSCQRSIKKIEGGGNKMGEAKGGQRKRKMKPASMDFLSHLPESIIVTILSLLPLKDAVRTSVLARPWRQKWRARSHIEIHDQNFIGHPSGAVVCSKHPCLDFGFKWFLSHPDSTIKSFSLTFADPKHHSNEITSLIRLAIFRKIKSLQLHFYPQPLWYPSNPLSTGFPATEAFSLPDFVYDYIVTGSLESLNLFSCSLNVDRLTSNNKKYNCLKQVWLGWVRLHNDELRALLRACPSLERLSLVKCFGDTEYIVVSKNLESLEVTMCPDLAILKVVTKKLKVFKYGGMLIQFGLMGMESVKEVDLDLSVTPYVDEDYGDAVKSLLMYFKSARVLTIDPFIIQAIWTAANSRRLSSCLAVTHLILRTSFHRYEFVGISCLLRSVSSLKCLQFDIVSPIDHYEVFEDGSEPPFNPEKFWDSLTNPPRDYSPVMSIQQAVFNGIQGTLQEVIINRFQGTVNEMSFLRFIRRFCKVLTTLRLIVAKDENVAKYWHEAVGVQYWKWESYFEVDVLIS